ncbi:hypothetical protein [Alicyclobacillus mengziensis]|uniref:Uncharacterized protein n=1 Tax=Alicyclobacillus mengziensis TaxID=2931921 RepID=A0A9X7Z6B5_9BACL|nr:hypothetical protein [Alicyclobacillus mengziensis]QSO46171.1 hypothetical protein JZ786_16870 [Alicyclobacillus mengziensis]
MRNLQQSNVFETLTLAKDDVMEWSEFMNRVKTMVETSQIKVVDVKRHGDKLTITYRRLL